MKIQKMLNVNLDIKSVHIYSRSTELYSILEEKFYIQKNASDIQNHHSYESAVLLYRLVRSKEFYLSSLDKELPEGNLDTLINPQKESFLDLIEAILLHDFNMKIKLSIYKSFFCMLFDDC